MNRDFLNRRKHQRITFDGTVSLEFYRDRYECLQIKDLSLTGMFVKGRIMQRQLEHCHIRIFQPDIAGDNCVRALGEVIWSNEEGVGLRFTRMEVEDYILLQTTLITHASRPETILREIPRDCPFEVVN